MTKEQVQALRERERRLFGDGGDVRAHLPGLRSKVESEELRRLLPGYVRRFIEQACPLVGIGVEGDLSGMFSLKSMSAGAMDPLWPILESYPPDQRGKLTVYKPGNGERAVFLHPGEPLFDRLRAWVCSRFGLAALRGGVFVDPYAQRPYMFHLGVVAVERRSDSTLRALARDEVLDYRLVGLRQEDGGPVEECPVEHLLLLKGGNGIPISAVRFATTAGESRQKAKVYAEDRIAHSLADERRRTLLESLPSRLDFVARGYDYQDAEVAAMRAKLSERAREGDPRAKGEITRIRERQRTLLARREEALATLRREPDLISAGEVTFLAHALVLPSDDPEDRKRHDREVEAIAVKVAWAYEEASGAAVADVSTPEMACAAGLVERPGFDLLSRRPNGEDKAIEVKGRAGIGDVELSENEWVKACNLGDRYWLYVVFDCASPHPRLLRVRDPFRSLIVRAKGSVIVDDGDIFAAAEADHGGLRDK